MQGTVHMSTSQNHFNIIVYSEDEKIICDFEISRKDMGKFIGCAQTPMEYLLLPKGDNHAQ